MTCLAGVIHQLERYVVVDNVAGASVGGRIAKFTGYGLALFQSGRATHNGASFDDGSLGRKSVTKRSALHVKIIGPLGVARRMLVVAGMVSVLVAISEYYLLRYRKYSVYVA